MIGGEKNQLFQRKGFQIHLGAYRKRLFERAAFVFYIIFAFALLERRQEKEPIREYHLDVSIEMFLQLPSLL